MDGDGRRTAYIAMCSAQKRIPPMPMKADDIATLIKEGIEDAEVEIIDLAGDGDHYKAVVISPVFAGMSRVKQHQLVYASLKGRMGGELHALALETRAPA